MSDDYIPPKCGPTINKLDDNFTYLDYFPLFVMDDIIAEICWFTTSNATHKGKPDFQAPTVEKLKAYFGLYITQIIIYLYRKKANGYSIHQDFQMYLPVRAMKKSNATCIFVTSMSKYQTDLVPPMTCCTKLVLFSVTFRKNSRHYGFLGHMYQ